MNLPDATYRLQFRDGFGFAEAEAAVPYLQRLGISHLYASPLFAAVGGSTHGYDVTDHNRIDPTLGGRKGFDRLCATLHEAGMGLVLDIVPNHMATSLENPWWRSVVQWGRESPFAGHFDIDWSRKLTLPFLGRPFDEAVAAGEISLALDTRNATLALRYFEMLTPLHPSTWGFALDGGGENAGGQLVRAAAAGAEAVDAAVSAIAAGAEAERLAHELDRLSQDGERLRDVHARQPWRLDFWKNARKNLSYRRFFEVTGLVGVRVEEQSVFDDVHRLTLELVRSGQVQGLRIDHVDGLADPAAYLDRLRRAVGPQVYIVVEKILEHGERLPREWPVQGTTGYEFIDATADLFVEAEGLARLREGYASATGCPPVAAMREAAKHQVATHNFEGELERLAALVAQSVPDIATQALREALSALLVAMPVYRTYVADGEAGNADREVLAIARARALAAHPVDGAHALERVCDLLSGDAGAKGGDARMIRERFQQLSGPVMAKGVEDTLFYRDACFLALNEVGTSPERPPPATGRFHRAMTEQAQRSPHSMIATATHDTKRGEDARARLFALSLAPGEWLSGVKRWRSMNADAIADMPGGPAPEPHVEHLLFQSLAAMTPFGELGEENLPSIRERFLPFVEKALREAKLRTGWLDPDTRYEQAVTAYADRLLGSRGEAFRADFSATLAPFAAAGWRNSLAQALVKLTAPGIPDLYQGAERGDFSLVDPDNRKRPDFRTLARLLPHELPRGDDFAAQKQWLTTRVLEVRRQRRELFVSGDYVPLEAPAGIVAFARTHGGGAAIAIAALKEGAAGTIALPPALRDLGFVDALTGAMRKGHEVTAPSGGATCALLVSISAQ